MKLIGKGIPFSDERIIVLGLGHPGKTSIMLVFQGRGPQRVLQLEIPITHGLNINRIRFNNREIDLIDLGGSISLMQDWMVPCESWFQTSIALIYVVDSSCSDQLEIEKTQKFFQNVIACRNRVSPHAKIFLFLHCTDKLEYENRNDKLEKLESFFREGILESFITYKTTLMDDSVSKAFNEIRKQI